MGVDLELESGLPDRSFHLQLDQPVQLDCVLERQLFSDRFDKSADDHGHRFFFRDATAGKVE